MDIIGMDDSKSWVSCFVKTINLWIPSIDGPGRDRPLHIYHSTSIPMNNVYCKSNHVILIKGLEKIINMDHREYNLI
jgi:hypothetical protein